MTERKSRGIRDGDSRDSVKQNISHPWPYKTLLLCCESNGAIFKQFCCDAQCNQFNKGYWDLPLFSRIERALGQHYCCS